MQFPTVFDFKTHLNLTADEIEYDAELPRHLEAAKEKVIAYVNRPVFEEAPPEPLANSLIVNSSINRAILDIAGYYFDAKGAVDSSLVSNMLEAFVGHERLTRI